MDDKNECENINVTFIKNTNDLNFFRQPISETTGKIIMIDIKKKRLTISSNGQKYHGIQISKLCVKNENDFNSCVIKKTPSNLECKNTNEYP